MSETLQIQRWTGTQWVNISPETQGPVDFGLLTNTYYVDPDGDDGLGTGMINRPFKTIQRALDEIGPALDNAGWQDATKQSFIIKPSPATYTEDLVIPFRPYLRFQVDGVTLKGDHSMTIDDQMDGGGIVSPQLVFASEGVREFWPDAIGTQHGILGNLTVTSNSTTSNYAQVNFDHCGITGHISMQGNYSGGQVRLESALIGGKIIGPLSGSSVATVWARGALSNPDFGGTHGIGGLSGRANYGMLDNVLISGDVDATSTLPARWVNSRFLTGKTYDFTNFSGTISMDANTYAECREFADVFPPDSYKMDGGNRRETTDISVDAILEDADNQVSLNSTELNTYNLVPNSIEAFLIDDIIEVLQLGVGQSIIQAPAGVELNGVDAGLAIISRRYNSLELQQIATDAWIAKGDIPTGVIAVGGTETEYVDANGQKWRAHTFNGNDTFTVLQGGYVEFELIGGGGGGGGAYEGGGGGAGQFLLSAATLTAQAYTIVIGAGGNGGIGQTSYATNGGDSQIVGLAIAIGGGFGGSGGLWPHKGNDGASGGGSGLNVGPGIGLAGNDGGDGGDAFAGGGGGGSETAGEDGDESGFPDLGGDGGDGLESTILGIIQRLAGGGGGGVRLSSGIAGKGKAGGGDGGKTTNGENADDNTGSGGGGGGSPGGFSNGGDGGSGKCMIRYKIA